MLKRFLKLLKGSPEPPADFEGTYFEHLLDRVRPRVEQQLRDCPAHDPLLVLIAEILLETAPGVWAPTYRAPLLDAHSPGLKPPPAPAVARAAADASDSGESVEGEAIVDVVEETAEFEAGAPGDADEGPESAGDESTQDDGESEDEVSEDEVSDDEVSEDEVSDDEVSEDEVLSAEPETVEVDIDEVLESERDLAGLVNPLDETAEFEAAPEARTADGKAQLDLPEVLQAGRALLNVLLNNERLPPEQQLTVTEVLLACELWLDFVLGSRGVEGRAQKLLGLVEQKFGDGQFSQARILLQLFQTDRATQVNNDRNLFYEDMILRMGIRRRSQPAADVVAAVHDAFDELAIDDTEAVHHALAVLATRLGVHLHLYTRSPERVATWRAVAELSSRAGAVPYFLNQVPPRTWRRPGPHDPRPIGEQLREHLVKPMAREYVGRHIKTCYFVLRAVGDTGLEGYLDSFFDWAEASFGVQATSFMPELYRRTMISSEMVSHIFNDLFDRHFQVAVNRKVEALDDAAITEAMGRVAQRLATCNFAELAPGHYDLGGLVFDEIFDMAYETPEFGFRLHRVT